MFDAVLSLATKNLLQKLEPDNLPYGSYLAGGTAVALHLGHRRSADLDFFTPRKFIEKQWEEKIKKELGFKLLQRDWQTLIGNIDNIKVSLFYYPYEQLIPPQTYHQIPVASLPDLAAMKLDTILGRGTKRDLIDIYFLAQQFGLRQLFEYYQQKYATLKERELMIKKALIFFEEAEKDEMPDMIATANWPKIKNWLINEVKNLTSSD